jgi:hypothetical protein
MRTVLFFAGSTLGSIAFQASVALYPQTLQQYAWLVRWIWVAWAAVWIIWLLTHPTFLVGLFGRQSTEHVSKSDAVAIKESFNPHFNQTGPSITVPITVNNAPPVQPSTPIPDTSYRPPKPNITFLGARTIKLGSTNSNGVSFFQNESGAVLGVIACFRNQAKYGEQIKPIYDARSHLRFVDTEGNEIGLGVSRAFWLERTVDLVDLEPGGESACVLCLLKASTGPVVPWWRRQTVELGGETLEDMYDELTKFPNGIEVPILDSNNQLVMRPIMLDITLPDFQVRARQPG